MAEEGCRDCGSVDRHRMVYVQTGDGLSRWRLCPQELVMAALTLHGCDCCDSCGAAVLCECEGSGHG